ncbi:MAG: DUF4105 domain-containing protein [Prevotellaceae bacterium]|nr:DUF4105 domain-containing protein [Prevotellaceae bacterium]
MKIGQAVTGRLLVFFVCLMAGVAALRAAEQEQDSLEVSLVTCSPGSEVYSLYGHTALRVRDLSSGDDIVFNYGIFNFRTPHFVWRFTLGQCDYIVAAVPFDMFLTDYADRGSYVVQQVLNLTPSEARRLVALLVENVQPENCTYRYNYLTNNCTTKVRDLVVSVVDGDVSFMPTSGGRTYRQLMHSYTALHPWAELGNDVLLGAACDTLLTDWAAMFLPFELARYFDGAQVTDSSGETRRLVSQTQLVLQPGEREEASGLGISPISASALFLLLCLIIMWIEYRNRRMWWFFDFVFMTLLGVAGCLLCFMFFFSEHPTISSNWQVWVLNPLPLLCMPWVVACAVRRRQCLYHKLNIAILTIFIVSSPWIPQDFCEIVVPLAFGSLSRSVSYCLCYRRKR